ncbi:MAG: hypothetical protein IIB38_13375 [Candidatus Hydrogenedentes bacterium]|nr:hypothetical protein [Candidatus Hydrogenedentota bacterium]
MFTVVASGVIDKRIIEKVADTEEKRRIMEGDQMAFTGIFAPGGTLCSKTVPPGEEGIVYADCDIESIVGPKLRHDIVGQYNRFDILSLNLNRRPAQPLFEYGEAPLSGSGTSRGGRSTGRVAELRMFSRTDECHIPIHAQVEKYLSE